MKANELRLGNWVSNDWGDYCKDTYIGENGYEFDCPIPLTEEILLKAGLIKSKDDLGDTFHIMEEDGFTARYTMRYWDKKEYWFMCGMGRVNFNYVHQLQNLYFALTGEELEIQL